MTQSNELQKAKLSLAKKFMDNQLYEEALVVLTFMRQDYGDLKEIREALNELDKRMEK